jgi:hypothetical protein
MVGVPEILVGGGVAALLASVAGGGIRIGEIEIHRFASRRRQVHFLIAAIVLLLLGIFSTTLTDAVERAFSLQERREWKSAEKNDDCDAFEQVANRHGKYSSAAQQRLDRAQFKPAVERISLPLTIPWTQPAAPTESAASLQLESNSERDARNFCTQNAQLYNGEAASGVFAAQGKPVCEHHEDGYICTASGSATCTYIVPNKIRICPK